MTNEILESLKLGASYTIGSHILPGQAISNISKTVDRKIKLNITTCDKIIEGVKKGEFDLGLIETPIFDNELVYKEWMEDELVICSKIPLPDSLGEKEINNCRLICRREESLTRGVINSFFEKLGLSYQSFKSLSEIDNPTAAIQSVKWAKPNRNNPTVAIVSQLAIEEELKRYELYQSRINNHPLIRKFYLIYHKQHGDGTYVDDIVKCLQNWR
ncbi:MAG: hypothetical protein K0U38_07930 [Epsilonproteobacteria bacterium]|nr:hypothetical protein [Campylobacterota bacterium]